MKRRPVVSRIGPANALGCYDAAWGSNDTVANKPSISRDGTIVGYIGMDRNLHLYGPSGIGPVVALLSPDGSSPNAPVADPWLNADGGRAAFASTATNVAAGDNNGREDLFSIDFWGKGAGLISATAAGTVPQAFSGAGGSGWAALSDNGTKGAFASTASDLAANDLNGVADSLYGANALLDHAKPSAVVYGRPRSHLPSPTPKERLGTLTDTTCR